MNHPQTNGKIERFYGTGEQKLPLFDYDVDVFVEWYNRVKPHMSLSLTGRRYDTPHEAFWCKLPEEWILQYTNPWFWEVDS